MTRDNLMYWALGVTEKRGYELDAEFDAYGAPFNPPSKHFVLPMPPKKKSLFDRGVKQYEQGDLSGALMTWSG